MVEKVIKLGVNREQPRLWIEGKTLTLAGFKRGDKFRVVTGFDKKDLTLIVSPEGEDVEPSSPKRTVSGKTTPHGDHPIIDISGAVLSPFVGKALTLKGDAGIITITVQE